MILKSATVRCYGVTEKDEKISWEKTFKGYEIETLIKKARKCFEAFLLINDISDIFYRLHCSDFGVYITNAIAFGKEPLNISVYEIKEY